MRLLVIDNYDSFTYNLVHFLGELGADPEVKRNDKISLEEIADMAPEAIVLSPGPATPDTAGICLAAIERFAPTTPMLGVCLGHQAMGQAFGGDVIRAPNLMHGKTSKINHTGRGLFRGLNARLRGDALPLADRQAGDPADGARGHRLDRRWPDHGHAAPRVPDARRAVPPGKHCQRERPRAAAEFPQHRSRLQPEAGRVMDIKAALNKIASRQDLTGEEMRGVMTTIMDGGATPSQIGAFLMGMRVKGETVGEIAAAVSILREKMVPVTIAEPEGTIDIVGTGGDGAETLNISTATSFVVAAAGIPGGQARQPRAELEVRRLDVLTALRCEARPHARPDLPRHPRSRHRLHVRAGLTIRR